MPKIRYTVTNKTIHIRVSSKISNELLEHKRDDNKQKKRRQRHHVPIHYDGDEAFFVQLNKPHRHQRVYTNTLIPNFVDELVQKQTDEQNLKQIMHALSALPLKQQRRFLLHHYYGLSINEIARLENVHYTAIHSSIHRAKKTIKDKLKTKSE